MKYYYSVTFVSLMENIQKCWHHDNPLIYEVFLYQWLQKTLEDIGEQ